MGDQRDKEIADLKERLDALSQPDVRLAAKSKRKGGVLTLSLIFGMILIVLIIVGLLHSVSPTTANGSLAPSASSVALSDAGADTTTTTTNAEVDTTELTAEKYSALRTGMTYSEAKKILGSPGEEMSSSDLAGYRTVMIMWKNNDGSNMNAMFQNGRLITKSEFGLR